MQKIENFWDLYFRNEEWYNKRHAVDVKFDYIKKFLKKRGNVLDIGFGSGYYIKKLSLKGFDTYGYDLPRKNKNKIIKEFSKLRIKVIFGKINKLPFESNFFDYVIVSEVLECLTTQELHKVLKETFRILKNGGKLILLTPWKENIKENFGICPYCLKKFHPFLHKQVFDEKRIKELAYRFNFRIIKIVTFFTFIDFFRRISFPIRYFISQLIIRLKITKPYCLLCVLQKA